MKLSSYENPVSGTRGNLFNIGNLWAQVLGVFVLIFIFMFGQKLAELIMPQSAEEEKKTTNTRIILG
jgi:hypothetical protein